MDNTWLLALILGAVAIVLLLNSLIRKRTQVSSAFSTMDVMLKRRYDLIPNLVTAVEGYVKHEADVLNEVTRLRAQATSEGLSFDEAVKLNGEIDSAVRGILLTVENYPDLKASRSFLHLQRTLTEVEEQISAARRAYNASVQDYNNAVESVPTAFIARVAGFRERPFFEIPEDERSGSDTDKDSKGDM